jgi:hypothetical protein
MDVDNDDSMGFIGSLEPSAEDFVSEILLQQLGSFSRSYKRESLASCTRIVSEMYSPPRVTAELRRSKTRFRHVFPGFAFDLTVNDPADGQPWDFSKAVKQDRARQVMREQRPYMLIGSPECKHFSTWQALNAAKSSDLEALRRAKRKAIAHIEFMVSLYEEQYEAGRYFLHEHPLHATSWQLRRMKDLMAKPGVDLAQGDQCQFGAVIRRGRRTGDSIKKPTGFLCNSPEACKQLSRRCRAPTATAQRRVIATPRVVASMQKTPRSNHAVSAVLFCKEPPSN